MAAQLQRLRNYPIYSFGQLLGNSAFGQVYLVMDVSTGCSYTGKTFNSLDWMAEVDILKHASHVSGTEFPHMTDNSLTHSRQQKQSSGLFLATSSRPRLSSFLGSNEDYPKLSEFRK